MDLEAIILAGGFGKRLKKVVSELPKPMAEINQQPFLTYLFNYLLKNNVKKVTLATGYLHNKIEDYFGHFYRELKIEYSVEGEPLGTGGGLKQAFRKVSSDTILIMNGDSFFNINIAGMLSLHETKRADLTIALKPMYNFSRYGSVHVEGTRIIRFEEKREVTSGLINAGVYIARNHLFDGFDLPDKFSMERDFLNKFTRQVNMHAYTSEAYFIDIGLPEDFAKAQSELRKYA